MQSSISLARSKSDPKGRLPMVELCETPRPKRLAIGNLISIPITTDRVIQLLWRWFPASLYPLVIYTGSNAMVSLPTGQSHAEFYWTDGF